MTTAPHNSTYPENDNQRGTVRPPQVPVLVVTPVSGLLLSPDGEIEDYTFSDRGAHKSLAHHLIEKPAILVHAPSVFRRLRTDPVPCLDILELFAFVRPAQFCAPTISGIAEALRLPGPKDATPLSAALALVGCVEALLAQAASDQCGPDERKGNSARIAMAMARGGWLWGPSVLAALGEEDDGVRAPTSGLDAWRRLPEWQDQAPPPPGGDQPIDPLEARRRLSELLGPGAEDRPGQADYASAATQAFIPRDVEHEPNFVMAEAGTGVGKTLGYVAPASLWAQINEAPVWLSTYTRNLQHQIDAELSRLFPNPEEKARRVVVRKGRENYLCLLNYEEAVRTVTVDQGAAVPLGLMARWVSATRDGDMTGGDFPSWLPDILGMRHTLGLSDRRGECIYAACEHFGRCFIERGIRKSRHADLVVANHALVMIQSARGMLDVGGRVTRFVFDEGHHVFDAADSAFSAHLSGAETAELRRWIRGAETRRGGRARGLKARVEELAVGDDAERNLDALIRAASTLPTEGWQSRCADGRPQGEAEVFLSALRQHVYARAPGAEGPYDIECATQYLNEPLLEAAAALYTALKAISEPAKQLAVALAKRLDTEADQLDSATRNRLESAIRSLEHRCVATTIAWSDMLLSLGDGIFDTEAAPEGMSNQGSPAAFVDWFSVERHDGRDRDIGMHRHWVDPMIPFTEAVARPAHGLMVTSATLTDTTFEQQESPSIGMGIGIGFGPDTDPTPLEQSTQNTNLESAWETAEARTGARHLSTPALRVRVSSPFDYAGQTRVFIVTDVRKDDLDQVAAAYRALFLASDGSALGLFTAISRLRAVYNKIVTPLEEAGFPVLAQHVDNLNIASLVDIFRTEVRSCLLGTDALRDGVDVPGEALRLIVFDRTPWPRPTLLHKARKKAFGGKALDDGMTRLRLKQAFGRLVRRADDRGVFVSLDPMTPSRLLTAFPKGVAVERVGLAEAVSEIRRFLSEQSS